MSDICVRCRTCQVEAAETSRKIRPSTTWCRHCIRIEKVVNSPIKEKKSPKIAKIESFDPSIEAIKKKIRVLYRSGQSVGTSYIQFKWKLEFHAAKQIMDEIRAEEF
jgi:hypothetical protein